MRVRNENGNETLIDLSQQLDYMRLSAAELTAAFNHPTINRTGNPVTASRQSAAILSKLQTTPVGQSAALCRVAATRQAAPQGTPSVTQANKTRSGVAPAVPRRRLDASSKRSIKRNTPAAGSAAPSQKPSDAPPATKPVEQAGPLAAPRTLPNLWLASILEQPALPYEWFIWLVYGKIAEHVGNSDKARFGNAECWLVSFNGIQEPAQPDFKGVFLIEKHCLGFLSGGHAARFEADSTLIGPSDSLLRATDVRLVAAGMDRDKRCVFIVSDGYRTKFGVPEQAVGEVLERLRGKGAVVMSVREAFASTQPIEVVWTVPVEQANPAEPQALESRGPGVASPPTETHHGEDFARQAA